LTSGGIEENGGSSVKHTDKEKQSLSKLQLMFGLQVLAGVQAEQIRLQKQH
jgi:hypothetical protein